MWKSKNVLKLGLKDLIRRGLRKNEKVFLLKLLKKISIVYTQKLSPILRNLEWFLNEIFLIKIFLILVALKAIM